LKGATEWNPFKDDTAWKIEPRVHIRQYYSTVGNPLNSCDTPYAFFLSIIHAMIGAWTYSEAHLVCALTSVSAIYYSGHYNLLSKAHAIHRDVSEGNILAVDEEATEDNKKVFETLVLRPV
jgi:Fungal protein kinase